MKKLLLLFLFFALSFESFADFINQVQAEKCETILEVFVNKDHILVKLEIGEKDYQWFSDVIPNKYFEGGFTEDDQHSRWDHFMRQQFILQSGIHKMIGKVNVVELQNRMAKANLYTGLTDSTLLSKQIIHVEIEYPLRSKIKSLSLAPPIRKGAQTTQTNIGFIVYHKAIPVNDLRHLSTKEKLYLDWADPWYSYFENININRHHSSSFMSFLYVEPYEVRHEILGRIKDLESWIDLDYGIDDMIEVDEQDSLKKRIANFLVNRNIIYIDGKAVKPIIDRVQFVELRLSGIQVLETPKPLPYSSAIIGAIFAYPDEGMPKEINLHWDLFNKKIQKVPCISTDPGGPWPYELTPSDSILRWTNFLKHYKLPMVSEQKVEIATLFVPLLTIIFISMLLFMLFRNHWSFNGLSKMRKFLLVLYLLLAIFSFPIGYYSTLPFVSKKSYTPTEAKELISQLLKNTYRAFDFREEEDIYDKLSLCNDTELLEKIYLQTRKSMVIENQGGIEAKVDEVLVTKVKKESNDGVGLQYRCNWIVKGVVGHWGHKHRRVNQYDAIIKIRTINGAWKMYDIEIIEEVRL